MKLRHLAAIGIPGYLFFLVLLAPASLLRLWLPQQPAAELEIGSLSGTLWHGQAASIVLQQHRFDEVDWTFLPSRLLLGKLAVRLDASYAGEPLSTFAAVTLAQTLQLADTHAALPAGELAAMAKLPLGEFDGRVELDLLEAEFARESVPLLTGRVVWKQASVTVAETASLGDIDISLGGADQGQLVAIITNTGGDISLDGNAVVVEGGDYTMDITMLAGNSASNNVKNSLKMLASQQPDGSYKINNKGNIYELPL